MKKHVVIASLISVVSACASAPSTAPVSLAVERILPADPDGPGCALSVTRAGAPLFERAFGRANLENDQSIQMATVFEAGSVSKQFTAAAMAVLISQNKLRLEDDVRQYLPVLPDYGVPITIKMVLTHTSGIRNWDDLVELSGRAREDASGYQQAEALGIITRQSRLNFVPGSEYLYSNSNYVLAVAIVERVSGESFGAFSARELFGPAAMSATQWRDDYTRVVKNRAVAYTPIGEDEMASRLHIDMPMENVVGPGGLLTTVGDLQNWNRFLHQSNQSHAAWVDLLLSTQGQLADGTAIAYGMGLERDELNGERVMSHAGSTAGYRAYLGYAAPSDVSLALLCNAGALNTEYLGPTLLALFLPPASPPAMERAVGPVDVDVSPDLAGTYRNVRTGAMLTASIDDTGLRFDGGTPYLATDPNRLENAERTRSIAVERDHAGAVRALRVQRAGNSTIDLVPVDRWHPTVSELAQFEGQYFGADVQAEWSIRLDGDALRASGPRGETFLLDPTYRNGFSARDAYWTLVFDGTDGAGAAVEFFKTRSRHIRFTRR